MLEVVAGLAIWNKQILLLKKNGLGIWWFPGGKVEDGERYVDSLVRELDQELGWRIFSPHVKFFGEFRGEGAPGKSVHLTCYRILLNTQLPPAIHLNTESSELAWLSMGVLRLGGYQVSKVSRYCLRRLVKLGYL